MAQSRIVDTSEIAAAYPGEPLLKNKVGKRGAFFAIQIRAFKHHDPTTKTPQLTIKERRFFIQKSQKPL
jgi:hypothetical protein